MLSDFAEICIFIEILISMISIMLTTIDHLFSSVSLFQIIITICICIYSQYTLYIFNNTIIYIFPE